MFPAAIESLPYLEKTQNFLHELAHPISMPKVNLNRASKDEKMKYENRIFKIQAKAQECLDIWSQLKPDVLKMHQIELYVQHRTETESELQHQLQSLIDQKNKLLQAKHWLNLWETSLAISMPIWKGSLLHISEGCEAIKKQLKMFCQQVQLFRSCPYGEVDRKVIDAFRIQFEPIDKQLTIHFQLAKACLKLGRKFNLCTADRPKAASINDQLRRLALNKTFETTVSQQFSQLASNEIKVIARQMPLLNDDLNENLIITEKVYKHLKEFTNKCRIQNEIQQPALENNAQYINELNLLISNIKTEIDYHLQDNALIRNEFNQREKQFVKQAVDIELMTEKFEQVIENFLEASTVSVQIQQQLYSLKSDDSVEALKRVLERLYVQHITIAIAKLDAVSYKLQGVITKLANCDMSQQQQASNTEKHVQIMQNELSEESIRSIYNDLATNVQMIKTYNTALSHSENSPLTCLKYLCSLAETMLQSKFDGEQASQEVMRYSLNTQQKARKKTQALMLLNMNATWAKDQELEELKDSLLKTQQQIENCATQAEENFIQHQLIFQAAKDIVEKHNTASQLAFEQKAIANNAYQDLIRESRRLEQEIENGSDLKLEIEDGHSEVQSIIKKMKEINYRSRAVASGIISKKASSDLEDLNKKAKKQSAQLNLIVENVQVKSDIASEKFDQIDLASKKLQAQAENFEQHIKLYEQKLSIAQKLNSEVQKVRFESIQQVPKALELDKQSGELRKQYQRLADTALDTKHKLCSMIAKTNQISDYLKRENTQIENLTQELKIMQDSFFINLAETHRVLQQTLEAFTALIHPPVATDE